MKKFKCLFCRLLSTVFLSVILFLIPFSALGQSGDIDEDKNELDANISLSISWKKHDEQKKSNLEESGSISANVTGKLVLIENRQGMTVFYPDESGLQAQANYQNLTTDKKSGEVYYTAQGSGTVQIVSPASVTDAQKQGHLEWMGFTGPAGVAHAMQLSGQVDPMAIMQAMTGKQKMDHYTFYLTVPIHTVITDKDGKTTEGSVVIHFGMNGSELNSGSNNGFISWTSEELEYGFQYQSFMGIKYEPPQSGDVKYKANWYFGEPPPTVEIHRETNGKWINITDDTVPVITGEKIKLRAVVIPEDKDSDNGEWNVNGTGQAGDGPPQNVIKGYEAGCRKGGRVIPLDNFKTKELEFYWVDGGSGEIKYTLDFNKEEITAQGNFEIQRPNYKVTVNASQENRIGAPYMGEKLERKDCWSGGSYDIVNPDDLVMQYQGIRFKAENLDKGTIDGEEQWVQILDDTYYQKYHNGSASTQSISDALDNCYPYQSGSQTMDAPGMKLEVDGKRVQATTVDGKGVNLAAAKKTQVNRMYLMFRSALAESEWVPIKIINWTWVGWTEYDGNSWVKLPGDVVIPNQPEAVDTAQYPQWNKNSEDDNAYQIK